MKAIWIDGTRDFPLTDRFDGGETLPIYSGAVDKDGFKEPNLDRGRGSRANLIAAVVSSFTVNMRGGASPSIHIDKPKAGSGAGKVANFISLIRDGRRMPATPLPNKEEEIEKRITSNRLGGNNMLLWDNIRTKVVSESLAVYETGETYVGRILGESSSPIFPTDMMMLYTTNNGSFASEHYRRKVPIMLDAAKANPRERTGFKYDPYEEAILARRADFVWAVHTMINFWVQVGSPKPVRTPIFASYTEWMNCVGGILEATGIDGLMSNQAAYMAGKDEDSAGEADLIVQMHEKFGTSNFTAREVYDGFKSAFTGKWEIESIPLDQQNDAKAIKQLSDHISLFMDGNTFVIDAADWKLVKANQRSPKEWKLKPMPT